MVLTDVNGDAHPFQNSATVVQDWDRLGEMPAVHTVTSHQAELAIIVHAPLVALCDLLLEISDVIGAVVTRKKSYGELNVHFYWDDNSNNMTEHTAWH